MSRRRAAKRYDKRSTDNDDGRVVGFTFVTWKGERGAEAAPPDHRHSPRLLHTHTHTPQTQQTIAALFSFFIFSPFLSDRPSRLRQARFSFSFFQSDHSARAHAWSVPFRLTCSPSPRSAVGGTVRSSLTRSLSTARCPPLSLDFSFFFYF